MRWKHEKSPSRCPKLQNPPLFGAKLGFWTQKVRFSPLFCWRRAHHTHINLPNCRLSAGRSYQDGDYGTARPPPPLSPRPLLIPPGGWTDHHNHRTHCARRIIHKLRGAAERTNGRTPTGTTNTGPQHCEPLEVEGFATIPTGCKICGRNLEEPPTNFLKIMLNHNIIR